MGSNRFTYMILNDKSTSYRETRLSPLAVGWLSSIPDKATSKMTPAFVGMWVRELHIFGAGDVAPAGPKKKAFVVEQYYIDWVRSGV